MFLNLIENIAIGSQHQAVQKKKWQKILELVKWRVLCPSDDILMKILHLKDKTHGTTAKLKRLNKHMNT